jgi:alpha-L-fucosidase
MTINALASTPAPIPFGPAPSSRQLRWENGQMEAFIHFSMNTFTNKEWGYGDESPSLFNPTDFDADQIVRVVKQAGFQGLVLTCKHHDGFCLWPSKYTEHSVKNSPWMNGKGDMVRLISDACHRQGLKFGVYLSPWDRNRADYGTPEYITYYRNQLRELLTNYGPIFEVWFDGANGGDGYYGGAREKRTIDNRTYYDWDNTWKIVRKLQPQACIFSDAGPDIRWVGNEAGYAGDPCWETITQEGTWPGNADANILNHGQRNGADWVPAEVDVSVRPGWFYHPEEDNSVRSVANLLDIYFNSVGRGCNLILNIPPDRRGQIHDTDARNIDEWGAIIKKTFAKNFAKGAQVTASSTRGDDPLYSPENVIKGTKKSFWCTDDSITQPEVQLQFKKPVTFNVVRIKEYIPLGQRVNAFALDYRKDGNWVEFASGTSIGYQRLLRTQDITTDAIRLRITDASACPAISDVGLFALPDKYVKAE